MTALAPLLALFGCGTKPEAAQPPPPEVTVITLKTQSLALTTELPGRTTAFRIAEVRPRVGGIILARLFPEGADVAAGQPLYQIDARRFAAELDLANANVKKAEAELARAQYELQRLTKLRESDIAADKEYQDALYIQRAADAARDLALSQQRLAALNLEWTEVVAPISGRIGSSEVTEGALVTAEQARPLTTIQQIDQIYVDVTQSAVELLRLKRKWESGALRADEKGEKTVRLLLEDGTPYPLEGVLQFRDITVDPTTGSYTLRVLLPNPEHLLLPGTFVRALVYEGTAREAILVPQEGVTRNPKGEPVALLVNDSGKVEQRALTLDRALGSQWLVAAGLQAGERLIVEGALRVRPGDAVKAVPTDAPAPAAAVETSNPGAPPE